MSQPLRILNVLGQRPGFTGSGVLVQELWKSGIAAGDQHRLICAGYQDDDWHEQFGSDYSLVTCSKPGLSGEIPFAVPGMSDAMPYRAVRYRDLASDQLLSYVAAFDRRVQAVRQQFKPDLLHVHHLWALSGLHRSVGDIPCVVTVHGTDLKLADTARQHRDFVAGNVGGIKHVFCVSRDMAGDASRLYGIDSERLSVLGNGYNSVNFNLDGPVRQFPTKLVLAAGKFVDWKGFRFAIRAAARVPVEHALVILGDGPPDHRRALETEAGRLGVKLILPGHLSHSDVAGWMRRADVFVLPSIKEPFGLVLLEAMACGCRAVASASGGPRDIISPRLVADNLAVLVEALDTRAEADEERYVRDFAEAITQQLEQPVSPQSRTAIADSVGHMTWGDVYGRMRATYEEVVA